MKTSLGNRTGKSLFLTWAVCLLAGIWGILLAGSSIADIPFKCVDNCPPNFAYCDGQAGVALGLCNGAMALECESANAGSDRCLAMEERFRQLTGQADVPWIYLQYPVNSKIWQQPEWVDLETGISCTDVTNVTRPLCPGELEAYGFYEGEQTAAPLMIRVTRCPYGSEEWAKYAFLRGVPFVDVRPAAIDSATFTGGDYFETSVMPPFHRDDTAIVRTCEGNYFKVGWMTCNADASWGVPQCNDSSIPSGTTKFYYQLLRQTP